MGNVLQNIVGQRYGRLVVSSFSHMSGKTSYWKVKCDCGVEKIVAKSALGRTTKSCGCYNKELLIQRATGNVWNVMDIRDRTINAKFLQTKVSAEKREYEFSLTRERFSEIIFSRCFYCGKMPTGKSCFTKGRKEMLNVSGIDRVNNLLGYVSENCVPCCTECNYRKAMCSPVVMIKALEFLGYSVSKT